MFQIIWGNFEQALGVSADEVLVDHRLSLDEGLGKSLVVEAVEAARSSSASSASVAAASSTAAAPTSMATTASLPVSGMVRSVQVVVVVSAPAVGRLVVAVVVVVVHLEVMVGWGVLFVLFLCEREKVVTLTIKTKNT